MIGKSNTWKVLEVFFEDPHPEHTGYQLRELSRKTRLSLPTVKDHLKELLKEKLIITAKQRNTGYPMYWADTSSKRFKFYKKIHMLITIQESGLIEYIRRKCNPSCIILYGSAAIGEDDRDSDVDLFIQSKEQELEFQKFEKKLKRKISPLFESNLADIHPDLRNNLINGSVLYGALKVF